MQACLIAHGSDQGHCSTASSARLAAAHQDAVAAVVILLNIKLSIAPKRRLNARRRHLRSIDSGCRDRSQNTWQERKPKPHHSTHRKLINTKAKAALVNLPRQQPWQRRSVVDDKQALCPVARHPQLSDHRQQKHTDLQLATASHQPRKAPQRVPTEIGEFPPLRTSVDSVQFDMHRQPGLSVESAALRTAGWFGSGDF